MIPKSSMRGRQKWLYMWLWTRVKKKKAFLVLEIAAFKADHLQTVCIVSWWRRWKSRLKVNPDLKTAQDEPCSCSEGQPCDWSERSAEVSDLVWERVGGRRTLHNAAIATSSTNDWCASWRGNVQKVASPRGAAFTFRFFFASVNMWLRPSGLNGIIVARSWHTWM